MSADWAIAPSPSAALDNSDVGADAIASRGVRLLLFGFHNATASLAPRPPTIWAASAPPKPKKRKSVAPKAKLEKKKTLVPKAKAEKDAKADAEKAKAEKEAKAGGAAPKPPSGPEAGTTAFTASRLLACVRLVQRVQQRTKTQASLLKMIHNLRTGELEEKEVRTLRRLNTPEVLERAEARSNFMQPMRSDIWRKHELRSVDVRISEPPPKTRSKSSSSAPLRAGGFSILSGFRTQAALPPVPVLPEKEKLLSLQDAVELMKDGGCWPGVTASLPSNMGLPFMGRSASVGSSRQPSKPMSEYLPHDALGMMQPPSRPLSALREAPPLFQTEDPFSATLRPCDFPHVDGPPSSSSSVFSTGAEARRREPQRNGYSLGRMQTSGVLQVFPNLAKRKKAPARRIVYATADSNGCDRFTAVREIALGSAAPSSEFSMPSIEADSDDEETASKSIKSQAVPASFFKLDVLGEQASLHHRAGPLAGTAQYAYLASCSQLRVPPRVHGSVATAVAEADALSPRSRASAASAELAVLNLDLHSYGAGDHGLRALSEALPHMRGHLESLNLAGNRLSGGAVGDFLEARLPSHGGCLKSLDLSGNRAMGEAPLSALARLLSQDQLRVLETLSLNGVSIPDRSWEPLCKAVLDSGTVRNLNVSGTKLGWNGQGPCVCLARVVGNGVLLSLDASWNFFHREGCDVLAWGLKRNETLTALDLSHNAGNQTRRAPPPMDSVQTGAQDAHQLQGGQFRATVRHAFNQEDSETVFPPLLLVLEALLRNNSLQSLSLADCSIDYAADLLLCEALPRHPNLEYLDLSGNPHGVAGLACLTRGFGSSKSCLQRLELANICEGAMCEGAVRYNHVDPSGDYTLDMEHPQNRTVLRNLLNHPVAGGAPPASAFKGVVYRVGDRLPAMFLIESIGKSKGIWQVQTEGTLVFNYQASQDPLPPGNCGLLAGAQRLRRRGRVAVNLTRAHALCYAYGTCYTDSQRVSLLRAMGQSLMMKSAQVKLFMENTPMSLRAQVACFLLHAVEDLGDTAPGGLPLSSMESLHVRTEVRDAVFFNPRNPNGRYSLNLDNPCRRAVALRLQYLSAFEVERQIANRKPDVSERGNKDPLRNLRLDGMDVLDAMNVKRYSELDLENLHGVLELDYVSTGRAPAKVKPSPEDVVEKLRCAMRESEANWLDTMYAFRSVSDRLVLTAKHVQSIVDIFAVLAREKPLENEKPPESPTRASQKPRSPARIDAVVTMYPRCIEAPAMVSKALLHNCRFFRAEEVAEMRKRLGATLLFDVMHCDDPKSNLPYGNRHSFDLTSHEENQLMVFLLTLAKREGEECLTECEWTEGALPDGWQLSWIESPPSKGVWKCLYALPENEMLRKLPKVVSEYFRQEYADKVLGWQCQQEELPR